LVAKTTGSEDDRRGSAADGFLLRAPEHHVSPRARWYWAARAAGGWLIILGLEVAVLIGIDMTAMSITLASTVAVASVHLIVMPQWRFRVHTWEDAGGAVYTQTGWLTQERRIAPIGRIQTVDTRRGPIEQLFGLSNVTVTTASAAGPLRIHGLERSTADQLVTTLTRRTQAFEGDAT
jgi:membrane protein YdbS with pleckstrin-like domain